MPDRVRALEVDRRQPRRVLCQPFQREPSDDLGLHQHLPQARNLLGKGIRRRHGGGELVRREIGKEPAHRREIDTVGGLLSNPFRPGLFARRRQRALHRFTSGQEYVTYQQAFGFFRRKRRPKPHDRNLPPGVGSEVPHRRHPPLVARDRLASPGHSDGSARSRGCGARAARARSSSSSTGAARAAAVR